MFIHQRWESSGFRRNSSILMVAEVILEIHLNLRRKVVCVYVQTTSCWCRALQLCSHLPFYTDSVCFELAWRRTIGNWPSVARIRVFCGGLQVGLWQAKIGWQHLVMRFLHAAHRENVYEKTHLLCEKFAMWSYVCEHIYETSPVEVFVFTAEAISGKRFRRLTQEKATHNRNW